MLPDVSRFKVKELLHLEASLIEELRQGGFVRTNNKPLGDIAEQVVLAARGGTLEPNSTKSYDVTDLQGRRIQVKAMGAVPPGGVASSAHSAVSTLIPRCSSSSRLRFSSWPSPAR